MNHKSGTLLQIRGMPDRFLILLDSTVVPGFEGEWYQLASADRVDDVYEWVPAEEIKRTGHYITTKCESLGHVDNYCAPNPETKTVAHELARFYHSWPFVSLDALLDDYEDTSYKRGI